MIQHFKISNGLDEVAWHSQQSNVCTRYGHVKMTREKSFNCNQRFNFFTNRIVKLWENLPNRTRLAHSYKWIENDAIRKRRSVKQVAASNN